MTVWRITGKIIRTTIIVSNIMGAFNGVLIILDLVSFVCFFCFYKV